jgi:hypothetical protein
MDWRYGLRGSTLLCKHEALSSKHQFHKKEQERERRREAGRKGGRKGKEERKEKFRILIFRTNIHAQFFDMIYSL